MPSFQAEGRREMAVARRVLEADGVSPRAGPPALPRSILLLLASLSACITAQGGYDAGGQLITGVLLVAGLVSAVRAHLLSAEHIRLGPVVAAAALGGWAPVVAAINGGEARRVVALLAAVVAVLLVCKRLPSAGRDSLPPTMIPGLPDISSFIQALFALFGFTFGAGP